MSNVRSLPYPRARGMGHVLQDDIFLESAVVQKLKLGEYVERVPAR